MEKLTEIITFRVKKLTLLLPFLSDYGFKDTVLNRALSPLQEEPLVKLHSQSL